MNSNLQKSLEELSRVTFVAKDIITKSEGWCITHERAISLMKQAASPNWRYVKDKQFPKIGQHVIIVNKMYGHVLGFEYRETNKEYFEAKILAWCEMPLFNKA